VNALQKRTQGSAVAKANSLAAKLRGRKAKAIAAMAKLDRVALFDGSGSMGAADAVGLNGIPCTRWNALRGAWMKLSQSELAKERLAAYVFSSGVTPVKGSASGKVVDLPFVGGGTDMCRALGVAVHHRNPRLRVLLVSDGEATDGGPAQVIGAAVAIGAPVDTVYVGPKGGLGRDLLIDVARMTGGLFKDMSGAFDAAKFLEHCKKVLQLES